MASDISILPTNVVPTGAVTAIKAKYLIYLEKKTYFLCFSDIESSLVGFIKVKGVFIKNKTEEYIIQNYVSIIETTPKDVICECYFPHNKIDFIRNLIYKSK